MVTDNDEVAMLAIAAVGCCMDADWRGRTCGYHSGYEAGLDAMRTVMQAEVTHLQAVNEELRRAVRDAPRRTGW